MAIASASASSALSNFAFGNRKPTIAWICFFSAWPPPTTDFLIRFGGYSATLQPAHRRRQQRHAARLAELQRRPRVVVDERLFHRRLGRLEAGDHARDALEDLAQAEAEILIVWST